MAGLVAGMPDSGTPKGRLTLTHAGSEVKHLQDQSDLFEIDGVPVRSSGDDLHERVAPAQVIDPVSERTEALAGARRAGRYVSTLRERMPVACAAPLTCSPRWAGVSPPYVPADDCRNDRGPAPIDARWQGQCLHHELPQRRPADPIRPLIPGGIGPKPESAATASAHHGKRRSR